LPVSRALDREPSRSSFKIFERLYNTAGAISILGHGERVQEITNAALLLEGLPSQPTRCPERLPAGEPPWLAGSTPRPKVSLPSCMDPPPLRRAPWRWHTDGDISLVLIFANVAEHPTAVSANAAPRGSGRTKEAAPGRREVEAPSVHTQEHASQLLSVRTGAGPIGHAPRAHSRIPGGDRHPYGMRAKRPDLLLAMSVVVNCSRAAQACGRSMTGCEETVTDAISLRFSGFLKDSKRRVRSRSNLFHLLFK
jgi:hypothetical protein